MISARIITTTAIITHVHIEPLALAVAGAEAVGGWAGEAGAGPAAGVAGASSGLVSVVGGSIVACGGIFSPYVYN